MYIDLLKEEMNKLSTPKFLRAFKSKWLSHSWIIKYAFKFNLELRHLLLLLIQELVSLFKQHKHQALLILLNCLDLMRYNFK